MSHLNHNNNINPEMSVLKIPDKVFIAAFIKAYKSDQNVGFYKPIGKKASFLSIFLETLNFEADNLTKLTRDRLYNRYRSLKADIFRQIQEGI